jgi:membrane protease YdiL (CAAX protease family)
MTIAFAWSWAFWIGAWVIGRALESGDLLINENLVWVPFSDRTVSGQLIWLSLLSLVGVFGPMLAGIVASRRDPSIAIGDLGRRLRRANVDSSQYVIVLGVLSAVTVPALLLTMVIAERSADTPTLGALVAFLAVFFIFQMVTSATEEIGWRGYLVHKMLPGRNFWDTGWSTGFVWAAWHYPIVLMIFASQGMELAQMLGSLAGFTMGIVAMSIFHTWFYERTASVFLNIVIHAAFNTVPLTIVLLWQESPAALVSNLLLWGVVFYLRKREGITG